jgi:EmrB/QacA subfamily drug resistance transporter
VPDLGDAQDGRARGDRSGAVTGVSRPLDGGGSVRASAPAGRAVLAAAVLGTALAYMSDDMLNLAVPSVARDLGATMTDVQWIVNSYYVTLVSFVLIAGSVGDIVGHRKVFTAGLVLFSLGALACAAAPAVVVLVAGRATQGIGAAMLLTAGLALVTRLTPPAARARAIGLFLGLVAAVPALGPFLSGALVDLLSWRWLFVVPLVLPAAALVVSRLLVPETPRAAARRPDLPGAGAALVALSALSVALIVGPADPTAVVPIVATATAVVAAAGFVLVERRAADPMLPLRIFGRRRFLGGNLVWLLGSMTSWGAVFFLAVTLQTTLGLRPLAAGLTLVPIYLVMMVGAPLAGRLAERVGPRLPILAGLGVYTAGLWLLSWIGPGSAVVPDVLLAVAVLAAGMATFTAPLAAVTLGSLDDADQGVASGVNNAMGQLAGLLAVVILPALAGLGGVGFGDPAFAAGYATVLRATAAIAAVGLAVAAVTVAPHEAPRTHPGVATS